MNLSLCTSNEGKRREFERILNCPLDLAPLDLPEVQALDTSAVCFAKAEAAYARLKRPVLVDDTGFEIMALNGFPGALVTWVLEAGGTGLLRRLIQPGTNPDAAAVTCIGLATADGVKVFTGRVSGEVLADPRGEGGFGFDPVFVPAGETRTFAEMSDTEKDACSPRGLALEQLAAFLANPKGQ
jgi:XTP/dITP diphosphohydrolase